MNKGKKYTASGGDTAGTCHHTYSLQLELELQWQESPVFLLASIIFILKSVLFRKFLRKGHTFLSSFQKKRGYCVRKSEVSWKVKRKQDPIKNVLLERSNCYARSILVAIFGIYAIFLCFKQRMRHILLACAQQEGFHASDRFWIK